MDDASLAALARRELAVLGLARGASVVNTVVVRVPDAYPVYDSTYRGHLEVVRRYLDSIANLHTVGRNGMHKYHNQDHSMYAAMLTVANLHGESHDVWASTPISSTTRPTGCGPRPTRLRILVASPLRFLKGATALPG